jgi:cytochrome d ubiquinol oxidase subunit II
MSKADACAAILWAGVTLYAIFGGADYGAGLWDLLSGSGERADRVRTQIDRSIGPVWEANHVWLIFVLVVLWTAFSTAFSAIFTTLYIPLALAALGIVLRGSGFAFRHALPGPVERPASRVFGVASVLTPFFMGTVVAAIRPTAGPGSCHWSRASSSCWSPRTPLPSSWSVIRARPATTSCATTSPAAPWLRRCSPASPPSWE